MDGRNFLILWNQVLYLIYVVFCFSSLNLDFELYLWMFDGFFYTIFCIWVPMKLSILILVYTGLREYAQLRHSCSENKKSKNSNSTNLWLNIILTRQTPTFRTTWQTFPSPLHYVPGPIHRHADLEHRANVNWQQDHRSNGADTPCHESPRLHSQYSAENLNRQWKNRQKSCR